MSVGQLPIAAWFVIGTNGNMVAPGACAECQGPGQGYSSKEVL